MNILSREKQIEAVAALTEGVSIRAAERLTGVNRGTILSLGIHIGQGCAALHDRLMRNLNVNRIELDEAWSFVAKTQARLTLEDGADKGDQYVFLPIASTQNLTKLAVGSAIAGQSRHRIVVAEAPSTLTTNRWWVSDVYKADVYDPADHRIGKVDDLL